MYKFYCLNVKDIKEEDVDALPLERKEMANRFAFKKDKSLSLAAGILFEKGLDDLSFPKENRGLLQGKFGKPYLKNDKDIHFNISHSGEIAIAVFSDKEIGCDIEKIGKANDKIIERCYSLEEKKYLKNSNDKDRDFYRIWVGKESFLKALGVGISIPMNSFTYLPDKRKPTLKQNIDERNWKVEEKYIEDYVIVITEEI